MITLLEKLSPIIEKAQILADRPDASIDGTTQYVLQNNLLSFIKRLKNAENFEDAENAAYILSRFSTDSLEIKSESFSNCTELTQQIHKLAK